MSDPKDTVGNPTAAGHIDVDDSYVDIELGSNASDDNGEPEWTVPTWDVQDWVDDADTAQTSPQQQGTDGTTQHQIGSGPVSHNYQEEDHLMTQLTELFELFGFQDSDPEMDQLVELFEGFSINTHPLQNFAQSAQQGENPHATNSNDASDIFSDHSKSPSELTSAPPDNFEDYITSLEGQAEFTTSLYQIQGQVPLRRYLVLLGSCGHVIYEMYAEGLPDTEVCGWCGFFHGKMFHDRPGYGSRVFYLQRTCDNCNRTRDPLPRGWARPCNRCFAVEAVRRAGTRAIRDNRFMPNYNPAADPLAAIGVWVFPDNPLDDPGDPKNWENGRVPIRFSRLPPHERYCCRHVWTQPPTHTTSTNDVPPTWVRRVHDFNLPDPPGYQRIPNPVDTWGMTNAEAAAQTEQDIEELLHDVLRTDLPAAQYVAADIAGSESEPSSVTEGDSGEDDGPSEEYDSFHTDLYAGHDGQNSEYYSPYEEYESNPAYYGPPEGYEEYEEYEEYESNPEYYDPQGYNSNVVYHGPHEHYDPHAVYYGPSEVADPNAGHYGPYEEYEEYESNPEYYGPHEDFEEYESNPAYYGPPEEYEEYEEYESNPEYYGPHEGHNSGVVYYGPYEGHNPNVVYYGPHEHYDPHAVYYGPSEMVGPNAEQYGPYEEYVEYVSNPEYYDPEEAFVGPNAEYDSYEEGHEDSEEAYTDAREGHDEFEESYSDSEEEYEDSGEVYEPDGGVPIAETDPNAMELS